MQIFASYRNVSLKFARRSKLHPARAPACGALLYFVSLLLYCASVPLVVATCGDIECFLNCDVDAKYTFMTRQTSISLNRNIGFRLKIHKLLIIYYIINNII